MTEKGPISTNEWRARGLRFEYWLRYSQHSKARQAKLEEFVRRAYPIKPKETTK